MEVLAASSGMKLIDAGRMSRRTIADAIEVMRSHPEFSQHRRSKVRTGPLHLPSNDVPFLVQVVCSELGMAVTLPTSQKFRAKLVDGVRVSDFQRFETNLLDDFIVEVTEDQVQVLLPDGRRLRGVEIIPYHLPPHGDGPRDVQSVRLRYQVIQHIVWMLNAEERCYRFVDKDLLPGVRVLDFGTLHDLQLPTLSAILHNIQLNNPRLNSISRQTLANFLRDWGLRPPEARRHRRKSA